jgi:hypothetical protein
MVCIDANETMDPRKTDKLKVAFLPISSKITAEYKMIIAPANRIKTRIPLTTSGGILSRDAAFLTNNCKTL